MKKHLIYLCMASVLGLTSCEDFNDKHFDGLDDMTKPENVLNKDYTLTADDYSAISGYKEADIMALLTGDEATKKEKAEKIVTALKAAKSNQYLTPAAEPRTVLPLFMSKNWKTASLGATIRASYNYVPNAPAYLAELAAADTYELTAADYETIWGIPDVSYLTPSKSPEKSLPKVLEGAIENPVTGEYVVVSYKYSANEPGSGGGEEETFDKIGDVITAGPGNYKVKGTVIATYKNGFLVSDGTASILVYLEGKPSNNVIGDIVTVEGTTTEFGGMSQFPNTSVVTKVGVEEYTQPVPSQWGAAEMDAYLTGVSVQYISYVGTLSISGSYYNVNIEGAAKAIGSIKYPADGFIDASLNGQKVIVTGYTIGVSSSKYVNTMATDVVALSHYDEIGTVAAAEAGEYTVRGTICAEYKQGFLLTDGTGYILTFLGSSYDGAYSAGDVMTVSGTTTKYSGLMQFPKESTVTLAAHGSYSYPTAASMDAAAMDAYLAAPEVKFVSYTGTLSISGNYYNVNVAGTTTAIGSIQYPLSDMVDPALNGQEVTVTGFAIGVSGTKYVNTMAVSVTAAGSSSSVALAASADYVPALNKFSRSPLSSRAAAVATEIQYAVYVYDGSAWKAPEKVTILNPADYKAMGEPGTHNNFSSSIDPQNYLPQFLGLKYPYAQAGDTMAVVYNYYNGDATVLKADEYVFTAGAWTYNTQPVTVVTEQYALAENGWVFSPDVTITLVPGRNAETNHYFQKLTDWVWENIDQKEGVTEKGKGYVTSYGNNDYYYGGSAYQNNFDFRPSAWKAQNEKAYGEMPDEDLTALMWERLPEALLHMLECAYPDVQLEDVPVTYVLKFGIYGIEGSSATKYYTARYKLTGKGEFTYVEDSLKEISSL